MGNLLLVIVGILWAVCLAVVVACSIWKTTDFAFVSKGWPIMFFIRRARIKAYFSVAKSASGFNDSNNCLKPNSWVSCSHRGPLAFLFWDQMDKWHWSLFLAINLAEIARWHQETVTSSTEVKNYLAGPLLFCYIICEATGSFLFCSWWLELLWKSVCLIEYVSWYLWRQTTCASCDLFQSIISVTF